MAVPKKRHSPSRQGKRRANWKLKSPSINVCAECGAPVLPHHACTACGFYKGKKVLAIKEKKAKKERS